MSPGLAKDPQRLDAPLRGSRLDRLPPTSNSWSASCHAPRMIAPTAHGCKRAVRRGGPNLPATDRPARPLPAETCRHAIVSGIIIPPHFRLPTALLNCDKTVLRWPGPFGSGFLSPQPPGVVGIGPVRR